MTRLATGLWTLCLVCALTTGAVEQASASTVITEFALPTANSQPIAGTHAPDGNFWFTEQAGNNIGLITPAGMITEFPIPTPGSQPFLITDGPDGNLWFTEQTGNNIGRINLAGQITEFPIPTAGSMPQFITVGPDGNLWFTELNGNKIGRITPAGGVTEFTIPTAASQPIRIIAGNDGNLWFIESAGNKIGRITTGGVITEFPIPTAGSQTTQIINGPVTDGNFWFTEQTGNKIGRITPAGVITEFPLPVANSQPIRLLAGRDNNIWFVESNRNRIGRITPAGVITEFVLPQAASGPNRIARGRDANLWFTENAGNRIGRISYDGLSITEFPLTTAGTGFTQLATSFDGNLWYVAQNGNVIGRIVDDNFNSTGLAAAVLPASRSVQVPTPATAFATIINATSNTVEGCALFDGLVNQPETFSYQTTDPSTNALTGTPNTPASIPANGFQTFVFSMIPTGPFVPADLRLSFTCFGVGSVPFIVGVNTLLLSASSTPVPDIVALGATASKDGIVHLAGGVGAFAIATSNVGSAGSITFSADTGGVNVPVVLSVCQTNSLTGACLAQPAPTVTTNIGAGETSTFAVFASTNSGIPLDAKDNRVFGRFTDGSGTPRGATSVAITTQ